MMGEDVKDAANRVAMAIRTGSNGQLVAGVVWVSVDEQRVDVLLVKGPGQKSGRVPLGRIVVMRDPDACTHVDFGELHRDFAKEIVEHVVRGRDLPFAELRGRDEARVIIETQTIPVRALIASHLADAALTADVHLSPGATEEQREEFVRGLLEQGEQMLPGMRGEVQAKLGEDKGMLLAPAFSWLVKGAGITPKRSRGRPRKHEVQA